jgi:hypothetical protein
MLMRNSDAKINPLLVSALLSMLESTLSLNAHSTPREVARKLVEKWNVLFLTSFSCLNFSVSLKLFSNCADFLVLQL